ncbi:MAG: hypothetical protein L0191_02020 [Acidobacteria bacterium]|nr:hypothetical protein [Acidobacteriota bacterium]
MEYDDFVAGYRAGHVRFSVDRLKLRRVVGHPLYEQLFDSHHYPRLLNRLATVFSVLIIPSLIGAVILPFLTAWWALLPCLGLAWLFWAMSYRYQREGVRQLALEDPRAYELLLLEGVIVVDG